MAPERHAKGLLNLVQSRAREKAVSTGPDYLNCALSPSTGEAAFKSSEAFEAPVCRASECCPGMAAKEVRRTA